MPPDAADFSWTEWHGHPSVIIGLVALAGAYLVCSGPLRWLFGSAQGPGVWRMSSFLFGVLVIAVAVLSPLHELGDNYLFSAHMVQHLLLILVAPPLLLLGTPKWMLRPLVTSPRALRIARGLTSPVMAFAVFNVVLVLWHLPPLYDLALRERGIHILEHTMFISAAVIMWWPLLSPIPQLPRASYLVQMLYLFVIPTVLAILGAFLTFADKVLYSWYAEAPRIWDISASSDQQIAGIIMWVPGGLAYLLTLIVVFLIWAGEEERHIRQRSVESRR